MMISINHLFTKEGYTLTSVYKNNVSAKLNYICPQGHHHSMSLSGFRRGRRCPTCKGKIVLYKDVKKAFSDRGYTLLSQEYTKSTDKLWFVCPNGHEHYITWNTFQQGGNCSKCYGRHKTSEQKKISGFNQKIRNKISTRIIQWKGYTGIDHAAKLNSTFTSKVAATIIKHLGYPKKGMSLDHIVPVSFFDLRSVAELQLCWDINNLRYVTKSYNCARKNNLSEDEIDFMGAEQLQILQFASMKPKWVEDYLENLMVHRYGE